MRLTRLELSGFKSFADDLLLPFENGVTAIVGPNGCGKSNISDAVRWVLGEQRARVLRGAKMDEVIFQGSANRKPTNIAEVALFFDNSEGDLPISYNEVVVKRRLSRSGQSEYLINNTPVRLRDVQDLLRGTGLGADAGVVIEARMIDRLLSDRAEERRSLFEEAAGIGLYRDRRNSTERRLERTRDDLQRLDDLISEVSTQVRSLARQKGKAERHRRFTEERFRIVMTLTRRDLAQLDSQQDELARQLQARRDDIPALAERLAEAERRREQRIQRRASTEAQRAELERQLADLRVELEKLEGDLKLGEERLANASDRKIKATAEKEEAELLAHQAAREQEAASQEQTAARTDLESVQTELDLRATDEDDSREQVNRQRATVQELGERLQELAETTRSLFGEKSALTAEIEDLASEQARALIRLDQAREGVEKLTLAVDSARAEESIKQGEFHQAIAELEGARHALAAARETEKAIQIEKRSHEQEAARLSARLQALEELERNRVGLAPAAKKLLDAAEQFGEGAILGPLTDFLKPAVGEAELAERALSAWMHAVLVRDGEVVSRIKSWHRETNPGSLVLLPLDPGPTVPTDGSPTVAIEALDPANGWVRTLLHGVRLDDASGSFLVGANGAVFLHGDADHSGPLGRREELEAHGRRLRDIESGLATADARLEQATRGVVVAEETLARATEVAEIRRTAHRDAATAFEDARRSLERAAREREDAEGAALRLDERLGQRKARLAEVEQLADGAATDRKSCEDSLAQQKAALEETERAQAAAQEKRVRWQVEEAQVSARERAARERQERSAREAAAHRDRAAALAEEVARIESAVTDLVQLQQSRRDGIGERRIAVTQLESAVVGSEAAVRDSDEALRTSDNELSETRETQRLNTESLHHIEIERTELAGRRSAMIERVEGEWHRPLDELLVDAEEVDGDVDAMREEAERLQRAIEAIGPVNSLAVEEHEQEQERLEFLSGQRADLVDARDGLWRALKEMDETARAMFTEMFDVIRTNYLTVFRTLFEGGNCDLQLADPEDPLNSDIDIHAAPRGKRTQRIHLLSSGERALVAISLLFAIYLAKPSPFCLLDEVDAPLDDSNVLRFVRLLDEFKDETQFIVITHNPRTMQVADSVYGVTMEEPGVSKIVGVRLGEVEPVAT